MRDHIWIDEATFYQRYSQTEPTVAAQMERMRYWEPPANGRTISMETSSIEWEKQRRAHMELKNRRRKEMENCQHGAVPFPIRYMPGVRPTGDRIYHVNIDYLRGGPYLLNEEQHRVLHEERHGHQHVSEARA